MTGENTTLSFRFGTGRASKSLQAVAGSLVQQGIGLTNVKTEYEYNIHFYFTFLPIPMTTFV
jgi:hypothetical protein